jgi:hypothetical protein
MARGPMLSFGRQRRMFELIYRKIGINFLSQHDLRVSA